MTDARRELALQVEQGLLNLRRANLPAPPASALNKNQVNIALINDDIISTFLRNACGKFSERRLNRSKLAVDLDDTLLHSSVTCPGIWSLGRGYRDDEIQDGLEYERFRRSLKGRLGRLLGRPKYDCVDKEIDQFMSNPRVIVKLDVVFLSFLMWLKRRRVVIGLASASAHARVEYLFKRIPVLSQVFENRSMSAEHIALRAVMATDCKEPPSDDVWLHSHAAHRIRPFSLSIKTPWILAPIFDDEPYDLLIDDSDTTEEVFKQSHLGNHLYKIDGTAFDDEASWEKVARCIQALLKQPNSVQRSYPLPQGPTLIRLEDPLYLPYLHRADTFEIQSVA